MEKFSREIGLVAFDKKFIYTHGACLHDDTIITYRRVYDWERLGHREIKMLEILCDAFDCKGFKAVSLEELEEARKSSELFWKRKEAEKTLQENTEKKQKISLCLIKQE